MSKADARRARARYDTRMTALRFLPAPLLLLLAACEPYPAPREGPPDIGPAAAAALLPRLESPVARDIPAALNLCDDSAIAAFLAQRFAAGRPAPERDYVIDQMTADQLEVDVHLRAQARCGHQRHRNRIADRVNAINRAKDRLGL